MNTILFIVFIIGGAALLSWPVGNYMKWAMDPEPSDGSRTGRFDGLFHWFGGGLTRPQQNWKQYTISMLVFNVVMFTVTFVLMAFQQHLPLNPDGKGAIDPHIIFNTAASFVTNTNLQHYSGEVSMSYFSQL